MRKLLGALALVLVLPVLAAAAPSWTALPRTFVLFEDPAPGSARDFLRELRAAGGHASVIYPGEAAVVYAGDAQWPAVERWIAARYETAVPASRLAQLDDRRRLLAGTWNANLVMREENAARAATGHGHVHDARPPFPDAGPVPVELPAVPPRRDAPDHIPYGAQYYDTSAYMAGTVAVGVWLLESTGGAYDWTVAEETETLAGVQQGLDNWSTLDTGNAQLTWFLDAHTGVPVSDDPISYPQGDEQTWINEVMDAQGWTGANAFEKVFQYNNALRDAFETNWCYSIFLVDSDASVNQGLFSTGGYAWSYYGGPWIYMSRYSSWAYNAANYFEAVPMHETGHTFWSTDEYDNGAQQTQGYLNLPDSPNGSVICIMNQNVQTRICAPTKRQIAWLDDDSDGTMEPLDTPPDAVLAEFLPDPTPDTTPTFAGTATVTTLVNLNSNDRYSPPHAQTICTIDAVECRVDGGAWSAATPVDGTFDAYVEAFTWDAPALAPGLHVIEARAQSSRGFWTEAFGVDSLTVEGGTDAPVIAAAPELALLPVRPNPVHSGDAVVRFTLPREMAARVTVHDVGGARVRTLFDGAAEAGTRAVRWNGRDDAGRAVPAGVYLVRLESADGVRSTKVVRSR